MAPLIARASAKVNLTLRVAGRRADGLHELESLVVFSDIVDELTLDPARARGLETLGPRRADCGPAADNLVLKAAAALAARVLELEIGHFTLIKRIPTAAGLGGGSADAAAALRLLAEANGLRPDDHRMYEAAKATGADVSVCLDPRPRIMRGAGEILSGALSLPPLPALLVNPGVALPTKDVFAEYAKSRSSQPFHPGPPSFETMSELLAYLRAQPNDLEPAAISLQSVIGNVLSMLKKLPSCSLARMSGSGATCFGLFETRNAVSAAAQALRESRPDWWVEETVFGAG